jgi:flagellar biosynthesis GTPase FlhF
MGYGSRIVIPGDFIPSNLGFDPLTNQRRVFTKNAKDKNWFSRFALHWTTQLAVAHRLVFNYRVLFITGGTGVGKTSQLPKLIAYFNQLLYGPKGGVKLLRNLVNIH